MLVPQFLRLARDRFGAASVADAASSSSASTETSGTSKLRNVAGKNSTPLANGSQKGELLENIRVKSERVSFTPGTRGSDTVSRAAWPSRLATPRDSSRRQLATPLLCSCHINGPLPPAGSSTPRLAQKAPARELQRRAAARLSALQADDLHVQDLQKTRIQAGAQRPACATRGLCACRQVGTPRPAGARRFTSSPVTWPYPRWTSSSAAA